VNRSKRRELAKMEKYINYKRETKLSSSKRRLTPLLHRWFGNPRLLFRLQRKNQRNIFNRKNRQQLRRLRMKKFITNKRL